MFKPNQTGYEVYQGYLDYKTKTIFALSCLEKSSDFNRKYPLIRLFYFQNTEISTGQGVDQIKPNWVWSIARVPKV